MLLEPPHARATRLCGAAHTAASEALSRMPRAPRHTLCYAVQARTRDLTYIEKHAEFTPEPARGARAVWGNGWL